MEKIQLEKLQKIKNGVKFKVTCDFLHREFFSKPDEQFNDFIVRVKKDISKDTEKDFLIEIKKI